MLQIKNLTKSFGRLKAVDIDKMEIKKDEITGLMGPNGAGKTTLVDLITGWLTPDTGKIIFRKKNIMGKSPWYISRAGIVRTFQLQQNFPSLTVLDNLLVAAKKSSTEKLSDPFLGKRIEEVERKSIEKAEKILNDLGLKKKNEFPSRLSSGEAKLLDIGRALMLDFQLLILDECTSGLSEIEIKEIINLLKEINRKNHVSILVIEHNLDVIWNLSEFVYCMAEGKIIAKGEPTEVRRDEQVIQKYLG